MKGTREISSQQVRDFSTETRFLAYKYITPQSNSKRGVEISGSYYVTFIGIPDLSVVSSRSLVRINSYVSYNVPLTNGQVELEKIWTF